MLQSTVEQKRLVTLRNHHDPTISRILELYACHTDATRLIEAGNYREIDDRVYDVPLEEGGPAISRVYLMGFPSIDRLDRYVRNDALLTLRDAGFVPFGFRTMLRICATYRDVHFEHPIVPFGTIFTDVLGKTYVPFCKRNEPGNAEMAKAPPRLGMLEADRWWGKCCRIPCYRV